VYAIEGIANKKMMPLKTNSLYLLSDQ